MFRILLTLTIQIANFLHFPARKYALVENWSNFLDTLDVSSGLQT